MSTAVLPRAAAPPLFNPWVIALTVTMATFMEVLDTSVANVSLREIGGSLSATQQEATWVLTSYLVANAMVLPLSGWLSGFLGRKRFYMTCVFLFTLSSALCGMAQSLGQLILFRVLQGIGGGGLQPSEQAILVDTFPPQKRGMAMAVFTMAILVAPILGPTLGGWITDNYGWRWIFYVNVPVGCLSLFLSNIVVHDPPHLRERTAQMRAKGFRIDFVGIGLLTLGLGALQVVLDKGQEEDWLDSRFIVCFAAVAAAALVLAVVWELRHPQPIVNLRLFKDRNFLTSCLIVFCSFGVLYGSTVLLPQMLQTLMGYSATLAGLVLSPAGIVTMLELPLVGLLLVRRVDARWMIAAGLVVIASASYWMSTLSLQATPMDVILPRCVQVLGAGLMFVPINVTAYYNLPKEQSNNASALYSLIRNMSSGIGVAVVTTLLERQTQFHQFRLAERINPLNPMAMGMIHGMGRLLGSGAAGLEAVYREVQQQAAALAYLDMFRLYAWAALAVVPLVLLMRRPTAKPGEVAAH
jgi:MFS transporter, DHA2 family, multidrug resistance protein